MRWPKPERPVYFIQEAMSKPIALEHHCVSNQKYASLSLSSFLLSTTTRRARIEKHPHIVIFIFWNYLPLSYGYFIHSYGRRQLGSSAAPCLKARTLAHVHRLLLVTLMSPVSPKYDGNLPSNPEAEEQAQTMPYPFQFIFVLSWHLMMHWHDVLPLTWRFALSLLQNHH